MYRTISLSQLLSTVVFVQSWGLLCTCLLFSGWSSALPIQLLPLLCSVFYYENPFKSWDLCCSIYFAVVRTNSFRSQRTLCIQLHLQSTDVPCQASPFSSTFIQCTSLVTRLYSSYAIGTSSPPNHSAIPCRCCCSTCLFIARVCQMILWKLFKVRRTAMKTAHVPSLFQCGEVSLVTT